MFLGFFNLFNYVKHIYFIVSFKWLYYLKFLGTPIPFLSYHLILHYDGLFPGVFLIFKFQAHLSGDCFCLVSTMCPGLAVFLPSGFAFASAALGQTFVLISCFGTPAPCSTQAQGFSFSRQFFLPEP